MCKCGEKVTCCCLNCALSVLISIISAFLVIFIIVGVLVWYFVYYEEDDEATKLKNTLEKNFESGVDKIKDALSK